jgi:ParB family chromosome partitioning protein
MSGSTRQKTDDGRQRAEDRGRMSGDIKQIKLSKLVAHPDNPNRMSALTFNKLVHNIKLSGKYEPLTVRPHPKKEGFYQIINGHHRTKALQKLGLQSADCVVWDVDDKQTAVLLATLNRLAGTDLLDKKLKLLEKLKSKFETKELSKLLPYTKTQIEKLTNLRRVELTAKPADIDFAKPLVFFVTDGQLEIIERALGVAEDKPINNKAKRRADALARIANEYRIANKDG